jgi:hypothetical protein
MVVLSVNPCVRVAVRLCNKSNRYRFLPPPPLLVYSPSTLASEPPYAYVTSAIDIDFFSLAFPPSPSRMFWNLWLGTINTGWGGRTRLICHSTPGQTTSFPLNLQRRPFRRTNREHTRRAFFVGVWRYETNINKKWILSRRMVFYAHIFMPEQRRSWTVSALDKFLKSAFVQW